MTPQQKAFGARTDVGCVRTHNEDSLIVSPPLYAVADGMGGHAAGEVASEVAVQALAERAPATLDKELLRQAVVHANNAIIDAARRGAGKPGMGCTLTAALLEGTKLLVAQVGDSRAYLLTSQGELIQLTRDHSLVEELVASGQITRDEAAVHPKRSIITRALGSVPDAEPDLFELDVLVGERVLLCSDGLSGMVSDETMSAILLKERDPQQAADALVEEARANGGLDNITAIVVVADDPHASAPSTGAERQPHGTKRAGEARRAGKARRRPRASGRAGKRLPLGVITFLILLVLLVGGAVGGVCLYASNVAFLRVEDGAVSVYRGLTTEVLPGVRLEWLEARTEVPADLLPSTTRERLVLGIQVDSLGDAWALVAQYESDYATTGSDQAPDVRTGTGPEGQAAP
ncbi:MAG: Stp1/IreP family PP2C-type Ser/Thr phosphatase [Coriobacteriales bacterium]|jgi:protein phosphatase|nr:Stp1/IreP family PP2C-type Ser/Thr phosphatase [Coriobacteriales bacterium]